jgi:hypothetical protein
VRAPKVPEVSVGGSASPTKCQQATSSPLSGTLTLPHSQPTRPSYLRREEQQS